MKGCEHKFIPSYLDEIMWKTSTEGHHPQPLEREVDMLSTTAVLHVLVKTIFYLCTAVETKFRRKSRLGNTLHQSRSALLSVAVQYLALLEDLQKL